MRRTRFGADWYRRDARIVARALIGCLVVHEGNRRARVARIVETEAYCGPRDLACHAKVGLTPRTRSLLGEPGHAYVFLVYGVHECFNVTCRGLGTGQAVLVRAAEPVAGFDSEESLRGPGCFARAMGISRALDGAPVTVPPIYVCPRVRRPRIGVTARVGVGYAGVWADKPWRFFDLASSQVSRPPASSIGRGKQPQ